MLIPVNTALFKCNLANTVQKNPYKIPRGCFISCSALNAPEKLNRNGPNGQIKVPINCKVIVMAITVPTIDNAAISNIENKKCHT